MTGLRLRIDLDKIRHNARTLVAWLAESRIAVTGVTKAALGSPEIARTLLGAGVSGLGDSRIENVERMRHAGITASISLLRSPMLSQVDRVVASADVSFNTELDVIASLSAAAVRARRSHGVVIMVELGDLREGVLQRDVVAMATQAARLPNITLQGIGANLACRHGIRPDAENMRVLSELAFAVEQALGRQLALVSGGNSANVEWSRWNPPDRVNDLRLGESILLGREPSERRPIPGLHTDAITLMAEVIESKRKPSLPWGRTGQSAFGEIERVTDRGAISQLILAVGRQDIDPDGLSSAGLAVLGASSDHLIVDSGARMVPVGTEIAFELTYGALLRAMTSAFVGRDLVDRSLREAS